MRFVENNKTGEMPCKQPKNQEDFGFPEVRKPIITDKNRKRTILDYELSRYACYLIVQNGDNLG